MNISKNYLGDRGLIYFTQGFGPEKHDGRLLQSEYFLPFCSQNLVVLDFGCCDGLFLLNLPAKRRIGVEAIAEARERCLKMSHEMNCEIELYQTLEEVDADSVDVIISNHCLEHVPNPFGALLECLRILKSGGKLVIMVPFDDWRDHKHRKWHPDDRDNHLYTWSPMNMGNLLTEAGFKVDWVRLITSAWSPKFMPLRRLLPKQLFNALCRGFSIIKKRRQVFALAHKATMQGTE